MNGQHMRGVYVVEFAVVGLMLFVLLLGVLEVGRLLFTVNFLNESVRRGVRLAVVCDIHDSDILRRAVFAEAGKTTSSIIGNLDAANVELRYYDEDGASIVELEEAFAVAAGTPEFDAAFRRIRFVQVSIEGFEFRLLIPVVSGLIKLRPFRAVLPRESLGRYPEGLGVTKC